MLLDTPVRLGVQLQPPHASHAQLRDAVLRLEDAGPDDDHDIIARRPAWRDAKNGTA